MPRDDGFTLIEVLVAATLMVIGLFAMALLIDRGNEQTVTTAKRDAANGVLRETGERVRSLPYAQLTSATSADTLRAQIAASGTPAIMVDGRTDAFDVTRNGTVYRVTLSRNTRTTRTCGTIDAPRGTILVVGPGACGYPPNGTPIYHGPEGEASGCKVGVEQSPDDLSSGAIGIRLFVLNVINPNICTASLLGQATANAVCTLVGQSETLGNLLEAVAGRDGLLSILGQGTLGISVDFCKRSGTPGYTYNPPVIDLSTATVQGPETGETRADLTVGWRAGTNADGSERRSEVRQTVIVRQSTVLGES